ncbi:Pol Polyprotein [Phytophthora cinnamomi]|uniref:Pol Polyprotein n=1 Tax=Phytophthora cinnamomi TaxID=4785 RepID=UPI003559DC5F|nr:Pol Polyprotein [Phytophthora cinnamomi]
MKRAVEQLVKSCSTCQLWKPSQKRYDKLPVKKHEQEPWTEIAVDPIGPYTYADEPDAPKFYSLMMMDMATHWIEIAPLDDKTSVLTDKQLDKYWLCHYPRPLRVIHDEGPEFTGREFQEMLESYRIQSKPTSVENPQANGVLERVHQFVGNMIRTTRIDQQAWIELLPAVAFAIRATHHTKLDASPAQLVFGRDMMSAVAFTANWARMLTRRERQTPRENIRENAARIDHSYNPGDKVLIVRKTCKLAKLAQPIDGIFPVTAVGTNGTVTVNRGRYTETISTRRIKPYFTTTTNV